LRRSPGARAGATAFLHVRAATARYQKFVSPYRLFATLGSAEISRGPFFARRRRPRLASWKIQIIGEASADPKTRDLVQRVRAAKEQTDPARVAKSIDPAAPRATKAAARNCPRKWNNSNRLSPAPVTGAGRSRRALDVTVAQVQGALAKDSVLIELLRYNHYTGAKEDEPRYGAVVIAPAGKPKWVPLGKADEIERKIRLYQRSTRGETDEATLRQALQSLGEQIWRRSRRRSRGSSPCIISPDGQLSFLSFATLLLPNDQFLGENIRSAMSRAVATLLRTKTVAATAPRLFMRIRTSAATRRLRLTWRDDVARRGDARFARAFAVAVAWDRK